MKNNETKKFINDVKAWLKIVLFLLMMAIGFLSVYSMIWIWIGLPVTWWSALLLAALAGLTEFGYYKWIDG